MNEMTEQENQETNELPEETQVEETQAETSTDSLDIGDDQIGDFMEPDYGDFLKDDADEDVVVEDETAEEIPADGAEAEAAPSNPPEEAPKESTEAKAPEAASPPESPPEAAPPPVQPPAAEETPGTPEPSREDYEKALKEHQEKTLPQLEKLYAFSPEEAAEIDDLDETKLSEVLPRWFAKLHYNTFMSNYQSTRNMLPNSVATIVETRQAVKESSDKFFSRWPKLVSHGEKAAQAIQAYRQLNPQADMEQVIEGAGTLAMQTLGLPLEPVVREPETPAVNPTPPPPPITPGGGAGPVSHLQEKMSDEERAFLAMVEEEKKLQGYK